MRKPLLLDFSDVKDLTCHKNHTIMFVTYNRLISHITVKGVKKERLQVSLAFCFEFVGFVGFIDLSVCRSV